MATLYALTGDLLQIQQMIEDGMDLGDTLESVELEIADKLEGYAMVIKNIQSDIDGLKAEEKRLSERRRSLENSVKRMKEAMSSTLELVEDDDKGKKRVKTDKFSFYFIERASAIVEDVNELPINFIKTEIKADSKALTEYLKLGNEVKGATLKVNKSLSIR
ncbi:siphovirus Gp157 family protein [Kurthia populi]|uniref:Siphovirus Gp157 family protein n=1 Tax=Kurthia populi TaxID=1562132 RepID=A0ABW5Y3K8_9BACL